MKRKLLVTILCLAISISMIACGNVNTSEQQEVMAIEQITETEIIETSTEQVEENTSEQVEQANISEEADTFHRYIRHKLIRHYIRIFK